MLLFCVQSDFVISFYRGGSGLQILRPINSSEIPKLILKSILNSLAKPVFWEYESSFLMFCFIFMSKKVDIGPKFEKLQLT